MIPSAQALSTYHGRPSTVSDEYEHELDLQEARKKIKEAAVRGKTSVEISHVKDNIKEHLESLGYICSGKYPYSVTVSWGEAEPGDPSTSPFPSPEQLRLTAVWPFEDANKCATKALQLDLIMALEKAAANGDHVLRYSIPTPSKLEGFDRAALRVHLVDLLKSTGYKVSDVMYSQDIMIDWSQQTEQTRRKSWCRSIFG